jgi:hypothetical protein
MKTSDRSSSSSAPIFPIAAKLRINGHEYLKCQKQYRSSEYQLRTLVKSGIPKKHRIEADQMKAGDKKQYLEYLKPSQMDTC